MIKLQNFIKIYEKSFIENWGPPLPVGIREAQYDDVWRFRHLHSPNPRLV